MSQNAHTISPQQLLAKADLCVSCGMCLPHCPTYQIARSEAESPRGRISLISALLQSDIQHDAILLEHLDHCLLCRSCESCCPASVPFAEIMDGVREHLKPQRPPNNFLKKILLIVSTRKKLLKSIASLFYYSGLSKLFFYLSSNAGSTLTKAMYFLSQLKPAKKRKRLYSANIKSRHTVALFTGCVHESFDEKSISNAIRVLNYLGIDVYVPENQQCCGAMHLHDGDVKQARFFTEKNINVFNQLDIDAVVSLASACTVTLNDSQLPMNDASVNYMDIVSYLETLEWTGVQLKEIKKTILLHYPCSQRNGIKNTEIIDRFLGRIPGLIIKKAPVEIKCCGAAGTYSLDYPDWSNQLKESASHYFSKTDFDELVTSNIGCALQFRSIFDRNENIPVCHPVDIMAFALPID